MRSKRLLTCGLIVCLMMASCASLPPPVIVQTPQPPAALLTQCPPLPEPGDHTCDAAALHIKQLYDHYGLCAGRLVELIRYLGQPEFNEQ